MPLSARLLTGSAARQEADIRKAEAAAEREEFDLQVKKGRYIRRDQVYAELAARAVTLSSGAQDGL